MADMAYFYGAFLGALADPFFSCSLIGQIALGLNRQPIYWAVALALIPFSIYGVFGLAAALLVWGVARLLRLTRALS